MLNKFKFKIVLVLSIIFVASLFLTKSLNTISAHDSRSSWGDWRDTSFCVASVCGTSEGTKTQTRTCSSRGWHGEGESCNSTRYEYSNPICPNNYHYQNNGNWNQRCHRNHGVSHTYREHVAPTGCPEGFSQVGNVCRKTIPGDEPQTRTISCNNARVIPCDTPTDVCLNIEGVQEVVPEGKVINDAGDCVDMPDDTIYGCTDPDASNYNADAEKDDQSCTYPNPDLCQNIDGIQYTVPEGLHINATGVECEAYGTPGVEQPTTSTPTGEVLGASTISSGKVLGASTMAGTGSFAESLYLAIMGLGGISTIFGLKGVKKASKKV